MYIIIKDNINATNFKLSAENCKPLDLLDFMAHQLDRYVLTVVAWQGSNTLIEDKIFSISFIKSILINITF